MSLNVGMVVDDRYLLEAQIGSGGMARVFRATNRKNGKRVALKEIYVPTNDQAETIRGWFRRELKALMLIDHPNVLQLIDHGETVDGIPYVVTELLEGFDLEDAIATRHPMPEAVLVDVALQALSAFETAHGMSVVHRDIKPGNLYLCNNGRLVVLDFGLARATNNEVSSTLAQSFGTKILGTPQYWSPEQIKGVTLDMKSDIFSLGGTLYFLASGKPPYPGNTPFEIAGQIMMKKRRPLAEHLPNYDPKVIAAVEAMLAEEAADRPTAAEARKLWKALEQKYPGHQDESAAYMRGGEGAAAPAPANRVAENPTPTTVPDIAEHTVTNVVTGATALQTPTRPTTMPTIVGKPAVSTETPMPQHTSIVTVSSTQPAKAPARARPWGLIAGVAVAAIVAIAAAAYALQPQKPKATVAVAPPLPPPVEAAAKDPAALPVPTAGVDVPVVPKEREAVEEPAKVEPKKKVVEAAPANGVLNCVLKQWAEIYVDGKSYGKLQLGAKLPLAPGKHDVLFKNSKLGEKRANFTIKPGKETPCKVDFLSDSPM